ncbi:hypothetical protein LZL87_014308 [Fusarium oxysporum]|uniref:Uncharacterized protein n=1 Tax=Fusarium oxysporum f. sp. rapae TaxID=485398 RepID=A0A8J5NZ97_FUSOX|nr:hypothetical protein Forpe1208_v011000 [Fusarium oxysporum f. sp. rapae]KAI7761015.1 hypothetical protein LZL87_014308 [Fusarium oxysporum]
MGTKHRASELNHPAKKMKSDNSNNNDKVSTRDWVPTAPRTRKVLPRQPITDSDDLPETTREQFGYLLQAIGDTSTETLYQVNLVDQINAFNSEGPFPPSFTYAPPPMNIIVGHDMHSTGTFPTALGSGINILISVPGSDIAHGCEENGCDKIVATVIPRPYAIGCLAVEVKYPKDSQETGYVLRTLIRDVQDQHSKKSLGRRTTA